MIRTRWYVLALVLIGLFVLAACGSDDASKTPITGDRLLTVTFDEPGAWEEGTYPAGETDPTSVLAIADGRYRIDHRADRSASFTWGAGGDAYENVIIEVETGQLSAEKDNLYGVLCRLSQDESGDWTGYALLISGDGHFGIADLAHGGLDFVLEWHQSDVIKQGQASNTIRAVCVDGYLAIYANDTFLGEVKDNMYRRPGQVGLIAGVTEGETVSIAFDNLTVYEGALDG